MGDDLKNRREFLGKIRNWLVGGMYAMIPLSLLSRGGGRHLFEIDTEKGPRLLQHVTCNCQANTAVTVIARNQGEQEDDHTGCACKSMSTKEKTRSSHVPWECSCKGQWERNSAHEAANDN
jgi:hypothetical protein